MRPRKSKISQGSRLRTPIRDPQQLLLRVTMVGIAPPIWRLLLVPERFTLHQLHRLLQIVFSRLDYHLYEFRIGGRRFEAPDPEATGEPSTKAKLAALEFKPGSRFIYLYDFGDGWEHDIVVEDVLPMPPENGWDWSPKLLDGDRAAPPEDTGGLPGYEALLQALRNPDHPDHEEMRAWAGPTYDPEKFDVWALDHALTLTVAWGAV